MGQPLDVAEKYKDLMKDAGYEDIEEVIYKLPINPWPKTRKEKLIGAYEQHNFQKVFHAFSMAFFTRFTGWSTEKTEQFLEDVQKDVRNRTIHAYWPVYEHS
jgi:hypothetical protein